MFSRGFSAKQRFSGIAVPVNARKTVGHVVTIYAGQGRVVTRYSAVVTAVGCTVGQFNRAVPLGSSFHLAESAVPLV